MTYKHYQEFIIIIFLSSWFGRIAHYHILNGNDYSCMHLKFVDLTSYNWLFGKDFLVTDESSNNIVDPFITDNEFNSPVIIETSTEALLTISLL